MGKGAWNNSRPLADHQWIIATLWFWGFWGSLARHLVGKYIIPRALAPLISQGRLTHPCDISIYTFHCSISVDESGNPAIRVCGKKSKNQWVRFLSRTNSGLGSRTALPGVQRHIPSQRLFNSELSTLHLSHQDASHHGWMTSNPYIFSGIFWDMITPTWGGIPGILGWGVWTGPNGELFVHICLDKSLHHVDRSIW